MRIIVLGDDAFTQDLDAVARVRIGFDDGAGDMALGGTAVQIQVDFAAERVNRLLDGLRAFVAGTVGAGRGQRASRLENREAQRRIGDADALRAGATIGGVGQSLQRAVGPGYGNRRERARQKRRRQTIQRGRQVETELIKLVGGCEQYLQRLIARATLEPVDTVDSGLITRIARHSIYRIRWNDDQSTIPDDTRRLCQRFIRDFQRCSAFHAHATSVRLCIHNLPLHHCAPTCIVHHRSFAVLPFSDSPHTHRP